MTDNADLASALFDFAVAHPDGFTRDDFIAAEQLSSRKPFDVAVRQLRHILATDTITLVCDPDGPNAPWRYRLVGQVEDGSPWVNNRLKDAESRIFTMASVAEALVNATDGRSLDGRRARLLRKAMTRLVEDLQEASAWPA